MERPVAVITGSSKGIGEACARRFLGEGRAVIGIATSPPGEPLASDPHFHGVVGDVADPETWRQVVTAYGQLETVPSALVLNAARARVGTVLTLSLEDWRQQFEDNVFGAVLGAKSCLPDMIAAGGGTVVVVSSVNGWLAEQGLIAYSATKATLIEFARGLAVDHAREGIRVNVVAPGTTDTPAFRRGLESAAEPAEWLETRRRRNPLGRILTADEIASVAWFLASDESSAMTGAVVAVDAGLSASYDFRNPGEANYRELPRARAEGPRKGDDDRWHA